MTTMTDEVWKEHDRRVRARMSAWANSEPTQAEMDADRAYWDENKDLFAGPEAPPSLK